LSRRQHSYLFINGLDRANRVAVYHRCGPPSKPIIEVRTFNNERLNDPVRVRAGDRETASAPTGWRSSVLQALTTEA